MITEPLAVTVHVSKPYVAIGGGWVELRPQGLKREYTAEAFGVKFTNTSKAEIQRVIRARVYRETGSNRVTFTFVEES